MPRLRYAGLHLQVHRWFDWGQGMACGGMLGASRPDWRLWRLVAPCTVWLLCGWCGATEPAQSEDSSLIREKPADERTAGVLDATWGVGSWVWARETSDKQTCRLWRSFEIPPGATVAEADLRIAVDNGYRLLLDGRELGIGSDWRSVTQYNIGLLLDPGWHVLAVEAFNDNREAGMLFGLRIELTDGRKLLIPSDPDWRVVPADERAWERRHTAPAPWGKAVVVSAFLPRTGGWFARAPTMIVKVPVLRPVEQRFWQHGWFQAVLVSAIVLAVKEALNNAAKYSGATELFLRIHLHDQTVRVVVEDNGAGFDPEMVDPARNGLTNMAERMREVDGRFRIISSEGAGCRVEFQVPLLKPPTRPAAAGCQLDLPLALVQGCRRHPQPLPIAIQRRSPNDATIPFPFRCQDRHPFAAPRGVGGRPTRHPRKLAAADLGISRLYLRLHLRDRRGGVAGDSHRQAGCDPDGRLSPAHVGHRIHGPAQGDAAGDADHHPDRFRRG